MKDLDTFYTDATCYESEMRYPTDQKLLWECCEKAYSIMCAVCQRLGIHRPRTKFLDVEKANLTSIGRKIENFDMSIGAIALQHMMVMVTDNVDHLGRIRGIEIENWKTDNPKV